MVCVSSVTLEGVAALRLRHALPFLCDGRGFVSLSLSLQHCSAAMVAGLKPHRSVPVVICMWNSVFKEKISEPSCLQEKLARSGCSPVELFIQMAPVLCQHCLWACQHWVLTVLRCCCNSHLAPTTSLSALLGTGFQWELWGMGLAPTVQPCCHHCKPNARAEQGGWGPRGAQG